MKRQISSSGFSLLEVLVSLIVSLFVASTALHMLAGVYTAHRMAVERSSLSLHLWNASERFRADQGGTAATWEPPAGGRSLHRTLVSRKGTFYEKQWEVLRARR